jgi:AAA+ superfamily predicted ATPase
MNKTTEQPNSELALMSDIYKLSDAGAAVIHVRSREPLRAALVLRKNLIGSANTEYREWDIVNGFRSFTTENFTDNSLKGGNEQFGPAISAPLAQLRDPASSVNGHKDKVHYFVYVDAHQLMLNNPFVTEIVQQYAAILPSTNVCIIFVTPQVTLESIPPGTVIVADMKTPGVDELAETLNGLVSKSTQDFPSGSELTDDDVRQVAQLGLGLSLFEFETYAALALVTASIQREQSITLDIMLDGIAVGKTEVVKQSEILELYHSVDISEVGGMQRLKDWVESRRNTFNDDARAFGIEPPKGVGVVGVPGTGKSLIAKAIASVLGIPLVRLDIARVFSKYVGDSESRVRNALNMVESMAPCVLFVDEIDKALGGAGGGGDSGTSSRVLGTFLTWLNDCKAPVFTMVTANKTDGLPPELFRKGRFDQIFSVGMPNYEERAEVLYIHLRKRGHDVVFGRMDMVRFREHSENYVPAEIEAAVRDALILAFNAGEDLSMEHIVTALKDMVPMSVSNAAQIAAMIEWAATNAVPVNYPPKEIEEVATQGGQVGGGQRRMRNSRGNSAGA